MGGRSGGGASGGMGRGQRFGISKNGRDFSQIPGLQSVSDPAVKKELIQALVDYDNELGVRQTNIFLTNLKGAYGEATSIGGKSYSVKLDSKTFNGTAKEITAKMQKEMDSGWLTKTNAPLKMTLAHELGHATWSKYHKSAAAQGARKEVLSAFRKFKKDTGATGWGRYSKSSYGEWFAEGVAKHMYGQKDKHTQTIVGIIKKWNL